jgi:hypothetical protein
LRFRKSLRMRQLLRIPHPSISITVFGNNGKYILKLEAGPMEQTYKIAEEVLGGPENANVLLDQAFLSECLAHFNGMYRSLMDAQNRFEGRKAQ